MPSSTPRPAGSIALPSFRLSIGVTGHRAGNAAFSANAAAIDTTLSAVFDMVDAAIAARPGAAATRLHALLASGADLLATEQALARGWEVTAPLPFGLALNAAIDSRPVNAEDALALIAGRDAECSVEVAARAVRVHALAARTRRFELAEQDDELAALFVAMLRAPDSPAAAAYAARASARVATAGKVMIEQSDLLVAIWDGIAPGAVGGTRHTIGVALDHGTPVLWIDARDPASRTILRSPEALLVPSSGVTAAEIAALIAALVHPAAAAEDERTIRFHTEQWRARSHRRFHVYRRVEALFGGAGSPFASLVQTYEAPDAIAAGSGAPLLAAAGALPAGDAGFVAGIGEQVLRRFAWADGLSTYLSDAYRGGMVTNFLLSALAIVVGVAYLPSSDTKWPFAVIELALLLAILSITSVGRRHRWHGRWFETRRVAEYLRHAPILLLLGVARAPGRWPRGSDTQWPERYARQTLRDIGLPPIVVTPAYLRGALDLLGGHVHAQRRYHAAKAERLARVHHNLDRVSEWMFLLAVTAVSCYLALVAAAALGLVPEEAAHHTSKTFTFLGVAFPALGGALAGIRYFGDFERFAAISEVAAEKLEGIGERIALLAAAPDPGLCYAEVAGLAHAMDDIVVAEIESWQAVFAGKQIAVPV